jgi:hypothetical protein
MRHGSSLSARLFSGREGPEHPDGAFGRICECVLRAVQPLEACHGREMLLRLFGMHLRV